MWQARGWGYPMQVLIVDGWALDGSLDHPRAGVETQAQVFETLIKETLPDATITTVNTHVPSAPVELDLKQYNAAVWTGGGGNIYENGEFDRAQLALCERVLADVPFYWGSCWGMQVVVTVLGGLIANAGVPEICIASDITVRSTDSAQKLYRGKPTRFDAPAHHFDEVANLPRDFEIIAENNVTLQAVTTNDGKIFCTQYHPELPYDYIGKLVDYWSKNYRDFFTEQEFRNLLAKLPAKEQIENKSRKIEFQNWLDLISDKPASDI